ncbi:hypothetical protein BDW02DRAFT_570436 [Decorospora gaudefroyi]|uniref:GRF-type domain-containing protein n=1 Tax=Decorospora gaudefroyi TaxID=184978 RepID=A0A6A5K6Y8_9PLEO|nr:hypothetical protein BDW02DRAFT_570436 [Decorospora gaudefroyi]
MSSYGAQKGLFLNGVWHCDCNPRLPAVHFQTKKAGPNQKRWFRACQKTQESGERCKFFLWDDHAHSREAAALANNSRTEPGRANPPTPARRAPSPPPPYTIQTAPSASKRKRARSVSEDLADEFGLGEVDDDMLNDVMAQVETPSKAARTADFTTPATKRQKLPWQMQPSGSSRAHGLQTPQTERRTPGDPFALRRPTAGGALFAPSQRGEDEYQQTATPSSSFEGTPTPSRFKNAVADNLVTDVCGLLQTAHVHLNDETESELRSLLSKHAKNAEGYRRGRDVSRSTVKAKEAKITELTYRISTLEAELEAEKATVEHLQWQAQEESLDA